MMALPNGVAIMLKGMGVNLDELTGLASNVGNALQKMAETIERIDATVARIEARISASEERIVAMDQSVLLLADRVINDRVYMETVE